MRFTKEYLEEEYLINRKTIREISEDNKCKGSTIEYWLTKYNIKKGRFLNVINDKKIDPSNPIFNYYCGLVATDGYVDRKNTRVSLSLRNEGAKDVLEGLKNYFEFTGKIQLHRGRDHALLISSEKLIEVIDYLNIGQKNESVGFPREFYNEDCARMFMRGVLDGDGNIHLTISKYTGNYVGGQFRLVHGSIDFIDGCIALIKDRLGIDYRMSYHRTKDVLYPKIEMTIPDSLKFYDWIYGGYEEFRLPDKYDKYRKIAR